MKDRLKSILRNGLPFGLGIFVLSIIRGYTYNIGLDKTLWMSAFSGIFILLANGLVYSRFSKSLKPLEGMSIQLNDSELLLLQAAANHVIQDSLVPGKIFLTERRMIFKAYATDKQELDLYSWDLAHLKPVDFSGSIWNSGGEFLLKTNNEIPLRFEVNKVKPWRDAFQNI